jgi:hypothetical protein
MTADILRLLEAVQYPVAVTIVELLARKCASELSYHCGLHGVADMVNDAEDSQGVCKNISYASFVMDLLGGLATHICQLCTLTRKEDEKSDAATLPQDVVLALQAMFGLAERGDSVQDLNIAANKSASLLRQAINQAEEVGIPVAQLSKNKAAKKSPQKRKTKKTKCKKVEGSPAGVYSINIVSPDEADGTANAADVLDMLVDVTAAALDIVTQRLPPSTSSSRQSQLGGTAESKEDTSSYTLLSSTALPAAKFILQQCGVSEAALRALGIDQDSRLGITQEAIYSEFIFDDMLHVEYKQLSNELSDNGAGSGADREGYFDSCMASDAVSLHIYQQIRSVVYAVL